MQPIHLLLYSLSYASATSHPNVDGPQHILQEPHTESTSPQIRNAPSIFNAIHSSMRQWGSSLNHNGMSFFPALIPEGTTLYHGSDSPDRVTGTEWLSFEIEHAEMFAHSRVQRNSNFRHRAEVKNHDNINTLFNDTRKPGYLHVYRANRQLDKLLYVDGMGAASCALGTLDTQDLILLNTTTLDPLEDFERADFLCELGRNKNWGIEGFVRMEAGFELILCNFSDGLDFVSHNKRPERESFDGYDDRFLFEYIQSVSSRYHGIDAGRVMIDYSSMVSAYFFEVNLSNPDPSSELPRLISTPSELLVPIKTELENVLRRQRIYKSDNWQGIVDLIVSRYYARLQFLASNPPQDSFLSALNHILNTFIDHQADNSESSFIEQCSLHYVQSVNISTHQDELIFDVIYTVNKRICMTLFEARRLLFYDDGFLDKLQTTVELIQDLIRWLDWSIWKACPICRYDEVCFVAAWPFGGPEDHFNPSCLNNTEIRKRDGWGTYWHNETEV